MWKVYVSPFVRKDGQWTTKRKIWASFVIMQEAWEYMEILRRNNPSWVICVHNTTCPCLKRSDEE